MDADRKGLAYDELDYARERLKELDNCDHAGCEHDALELLGQDGLRRFVPDSRELTILCEDIRAAARFKSWLSGDGMELYLSEVAKEQGAAVEMGGWDTHRKRNLIAISEPKRYPTTRSEDLEDLRHVPQKCDALIQIVAALKERFINITQAVREGDEHPLRKKLAQALVPLDMAYDELEIALDRACDCE